MNLAANMMPTDFTKNENFDMGNGNDLNGQYDNQNGGMNDDVNNNNGNTQDDQDQNGNYDNNGNVNDQDDNQNNDGNPTEPEQFRKVFIGGLSYKTDDDTLKNYFAKYGNLVDHVVMKDGTSGRSRGFGFVTYSCSSMVDELMKNRPHIIDGRQVEPKRATPREDSGKTEVQMTVKKLFIGGLRDNLTEDDLKNYFNSYGNVIEAVVMKEKETSKSRGFGFVTFDDYDPVDKIILEKHHTINGVNIHTQKALPKDYEKGQGGGNGGGNRQGNFRNNDGNGFGNGNFGNGGNFNGGGFNNFGRGGGGGGGFQRNNNNGGNFNGGGMGNSSLNNTYGNYNTAQNKIKNEGMGGMGGMGMGNGGGMGGGGGGGNRGNNRGGGPMRRGGGGNRSGPYGNGNGGGFNNGGNNNNFNNNRGNRGGRGGVGQRGGRGGGQGGGNDSINNMSMN